MRNKIINIIANIIAITLGTVAILGILGAIYKTIIQVV